MSNLIPGTIYIDSSWSEWKLLYKVGEEWECEFIKHHDGYIPNTPSFKLILESLIVNSKEKPFKLSNNILNKIKEWKQYY